MNKTGGFIKRANEKHSESIHSPGHYEVKMENKAILVRTVFNCSAKTNQCDNSLNGCFWIGPTLTSDLTHVLIRICLNKFVSLSNIENVF